MNKGVFTALLIDLDGTLIGPDQKITSVVNQAVRQVADQVPVSIVTGREPRDVLRFSRQLDLKTPQACDGGASVLDPVTGEYLWRRAIPLEIAQEILTILNRRQIAFIATHQLGVETHESTEHKRVHPPDYNRISALDLTKRSAEALAEGFGADLGVNVALAYLPYNTLWAVDITCRGVNKSVGARQLVGLLGTTLEETAVVGDSYNDLPLFESCKVRVAMGNAPFEVRSIASYVAPPVEEDGLASAIEGYLLPLLTSR